MEKSKNEERIYSEEYKKVREACIREFPSFYIDNLVFSYCKVKKSDQLLLLEDEIYIQETESLKAGMFKKNLETLNAVIDGLYAEGGTEKAPTVLKAIEMKRELLLDDVGKNDDLKSRLNIAFTKMSKDDFESMGTVEVNEGNGNTEFSANFGVASDNMSREEEAKAKLAESQLEEKRKKREAEEAEGEE